MLERKTYGVQIHIQIVEQGLGIGEIQDAVKKQEKQEKMVMAGLMEKMIHEQKLEENQGTGLKLLREEHSMQHQGLKMDVCFGCLKISKEAGVAGAK